MKGEFDGIPSCNVWVRYMGNDEDDTNGVWFDNVDDDELMTLLRLIRKKRDTGALEMVVTPLRNHNDGGE